jgi:hypothetical protein
MKSIKLQHSKSCSSRHKEAVIVLRITHHASRRSEPPYVGCYEAGFGLWALDFGLF